MTSLTATERRRLVRRGQARGWLLDQLPVKPEGEGETALDRTLVRRGHYVRGAMWVLVVYALMFAATQGVGTWAILSPLYLAALGVHAVVPAVPFTVAFWVLYAPLISRLVRYVRKTGEGKGLREGLARAALREERAFREGAEDWTTWERVKSCAIFSLVHLWNLYVPLALLIPMSLSGGIFMRTYLRTLRKTGSREAAVVESAAAHYAYNCVAVIGLLAAVLAVLELTLFRIVF